MMNKQLPFIKVKVNGISKMKPICPVCKGSGYRRVKVRIFCPHDDNAYMEESKLCSRCYGKGYLLVEDDI